MSTAACPRTDRPIVALVGNPNTGKTTLFNRLTGLRARTANFPGTTLERRVGSFVLRGRRVEVEDLPGLYGLSAGSAEERIAHRALLDMAEGGRPAAALVVVDQTSLARNLYLASQVRELGVPLVVALNMSDVAGAEGLRVDQALLSRELDARVVAISARTGDGVEALLSALDGVLAPAPPASVASSPSCAGCFGCRPSSARFDWAEDVAARASSGVSGASAQRTPAPSPP